MSFPRRVDETVPFRIALLSGCALAAALVLPAAPALANCQSGNTANNMTTFLLSSANCQASASGGSATAVGLNATATASLATAVGTGAKATGSSATAVGVVALATATNTTAVGYSAFAAGSFSSAFGMSARADGQYSTAIGYVAGYRGLGNTAPGQTALGAYAGYNHLLGPYSTTIGGSNVTANFNARALGAYAIAIGGGDGTGGSNGARANSDHAVAIGTSSVAQGVRSTSVGAFAGGGANAGNQHNLAVGAKAGVTVNGSFNAAFGDNAGGAVTGTNNLAIGRNAGRDVTASNTVAIGTNAKATATQAIAIGNNSQATVANTVSVGSASVKRRIMNVANGVSPNDAVNLAQAKTLAAVAQSQAADDIRRELAELRALVKQQQERIAKLESRTVATAARD